MYSFCWLVKKCDQYNQDTQNDNWAVDPDSWAITIAHTIISSTFIVYVIALDIAALIFRDPTPEYHSESYNGLLFHYPGFLLWWDILAAIIIAVLIITALCCCTDGDKYTFLFLKLAGVVPLLSLASHTHYILIAWITDPLYATGIKINYVIFYVIHLLVLKQSCKSYGLLTKCKSKFGWKAQGKKPVKSKSADPGTDGKEKSTIGCKALFGCITVLAVFAVWLVSLSLQVLVTVFFVYIPINYSIEDTPSKLITIIQGVVVLIVGLIAWKVIVDPRAKEPLAIISGALRKVIEKKDSKRGIDIDEWVRFDDEEKLAKVLYHVIKLYDAPPDQTPGGQNQDNQSQGNQSQGNQSQGNQSQGNQSQGNQSQGNQSQGNQSQGNQSEGNQSEGNQSEGNQSEGNQSEGNQSKGNQSEGNQSQNGSQDNRMHSQGQSSQPPPLQGHVIKIQDN